MLTKTQEELEAVATKIGEALLSLNQVTFTLELNATRTGDGKKVVFLAVTLWFGHEFSKRVTGGDDVDALARSCREVALQRLSKIRDIAKANETWTA